MIESYLGQKSTFLCTAFVISCEDSFSLTWSWWLAMVVNTVHACMSLVHRYTMIKMHVQSVQTLTPTHTNTDIMAFSCGPGHPHINDTRDQKCQHFPVICSLALWVYTKTLTLLLVIPTCRSHIQTRALRQLHMQTHTYINQIFTWSFVRQGSLNTSLQ